MDSKTLEAVEVEARRRVRVRVRNRSNWYRALLETVNARLIDALPDYQYGMQEDQFARFLAMKLSELDAPQLLDQIEELISQTATEMAQEIAYLKVCPVEQLAEFLKCTVKEAKRLQSGKRIVSIPTPDELDQALGIDLSY